MHVVFHQAFCGVSVVFHQAFVTLPCMHVVFHQAFFDNGAITIVMEYMDGGSLADVLKVRTVVIRGFGKTRIW
jgi:serine/threonine protein kinase